jgi:type II secretion system protein C
MLNRPLHLDISTSRHLDPPNGAIAEPHILPEEPMATSLSPWTIAGVLSGVAVSSWVAALGLSRVTASALSLPEEAEIVEVTMASPDEDGDDVDSRSGDGPSPAGIKIRMRGPSADSYVEKLVQRSIFDSTKVNSEPTGGRPAGPVGEGVPSDLKVVLLATLVADPEDHSSALIAEEKGDDGALGYGIGDDLLGEGKIVKIEPRKVYVERLNGSVEFISMEGGGYEKTDGPGRGAKKKKTGKDEEEDGITKDGPNKFIVDQELIDKVMENPEQLYSQVRATPHKSADGKVDGYRLSGIRRRSLFYKLGIKNGDVVHSVNGKSLDSMSSAMGAYDSLQSAKDFNFEVTRRNKKQTFEYEVR